MKYEELKRYLLCANCHIELHEKLVEERRVSENSPKGGIRTHNPQIQVCVTFVTPWTLSSPYLAI